MHKIFLLLLALFCSVPMMAVRPFIVSSYIRGNFFNKGRVSVESINACNDLICIGAQPAADGSLILQQYRLNNGCGARTTTALLDSVQVLIRNKEAVSIRLGISGGEEWRTMTASVDSRKRFGASVKDFLAANALDGVDLDFEWPLSEEEFENYSETIIILREFLGDNYLLSVSLHPLYYQISSRAIEAVDYVSLQCYGPRPERFSYDQFESDIQKVIQYGIPVDKLVAGVPFYAVAEDGSRHTVAYYDLVKADLVQSPAEDRVKYGDIVYIYNGQDRIMQKTQYAIAKDLRGMMSWDLATDVPFTNQWSLLRAMMSIVDE